MNVAVPFPERQKDWVPNLSAYLGPWRVCSRIEVYEPYFLFFLLFTPTGESQPEFQITL